MSFDTSHWPLVLPPLPLGGVEVLAPLPLGGVGVLAPLPLGGVGGLAPLPLGGVGGGRSSEGTTLFLFLLEAVPLPHRAAKPQEPQEKERATSPSPNPSQREGDSPPLTPPKGRGIRLP